ncbi:MAG TPA: tetratricopeptide repeat protein [Pyrinomonadaceae bacterium]|jgi:tetratricopeptide (TPR) repeat protein|nr:tetratricopeptide repeat protein [Pyrinomonadaceae bacterium]
MKNRECRRKFYVLPLFLVLLAAAALTFSACTTPEKAKAQHVARGQELLKDKKFQEAALEFRSALQIDEKLADAHWGLANAYEGLQRYQEAFDEMRQTAALDANHLDVRVKLGNYYLVGSKQSPAALGEAERLAKEVLEKDPNHIEGHILMGSVLFAQDKKQEAFAELNHAVELNPKRVESYLSLARFYLLTNDIATAEATYQRAISVSGGAAMAHYEYGKFLVSAQRFDAAEAEFQKAVQAEPNNREAQFILASFYLVNKQFDKAEVAYKALAELDKDKPEGRSVLGDFYSSVGRLDEAIAIYKEVIAKSPDYTQAHYRLAEIMLNRGDLAGAKNEVESVLKTDAKDRQALILRARIGMQAGQPNDLKAAVEDLREVLRQEPNSRAGLFFMAEANFRLGQIEQARVFAGDLSRNYPDYLPAKLMEVQINLASGNAKSAMQLAAQLQDRLTKAAPDRDNSPQMLAELKAKTLIAHGSAALQLRDTKTARQDFLAAHDVAPSSADIYVDLAMVSLAEGKTDEAIGFFDSALAVDGANFNALRGLTHIYAAQKRTDLAHARIDQAIAAQPNNASLHFLKGRVYGFEMNAQGAEAEFRKSLEIDANYLASYSALAALFVNTNQQQRAIEEYRRIVERQPDNPAIYTLIGMLEMNQQNIDAAIENYRKALAIDQNSIFAANNLAWLYALYGKGNLDEAVRLAQSAVQANPEVSSFVDTLGWVYYKKGLYGAATEQLKKAVSVDEIAARRNNGTPSPTYHYHLGAALAAKGEKAAARREIENALRLSEKAPFPEADEARKALATL